MTFRKFVAASTRDCLRLMREALGPDAMIVSTRRTAGGVEVIGTRGEPAPEAPTPAPAPAHVQTRTPQYEPSPLAATNLWDAMEDEPVRLSPAARVLAEHDRPEGYPPEPADLPLARWPQLAERQIPHVVRSARNEYASHAQPSPAVEEPRGMPSHRPGPPSASAPSESERKMRESMGLPRAIDLPTAEASARAQASATTRLDDGDRAALASEVSEPIMSEMRSMRGWLEHQMDALAWRDSTQRDPSRRTLWRKMVDGGFTPELARTVVTHLPEGMTEDRADDWLATVLTRNLATVDPIDTMVERGGRFAIVGPTGVGKTTTTAKIAAHCVVKYGAAALGLITTDQHRIGAVDQLHTFGQILGVEVYAARGASDLEAILAGMGDRRLVLVDTAGMSQRDDSMTDHLRALNVSGVKRILVMPGGTHAEQAEDIVQAYSAGGLAGLIMSKLDEAVRVGGVLDAAIRHRVQLQFVTNGQRVPDDLHVPNAPVLVHRALRPRHSPVFALNANELDWACMPSAAGAALHAASV
jgi:flagellar biosynthesis protein FlhF